MIDVSVLPPGFAGLEGNGVFCRFGFPQLRRKFEKEEQERLRHEAFLMRPGGVKGWKIPTVARLVLRVTHLV